MGVVGVERVVGVSGGCRLRLQGPRKPEPMIGFREFRDFGECREFGEFRA